MKKCLPILKIFTVLLVVLMTASIANAQKTAVADGAWSNPATWSPAGAPALTDNVTINNGIDVTVSATGAQCNSITFASAAGSITVNATFTLAVTTSITLQNSATANTAATLAGAGIINCASVQIGGTATAPTADRTTVLTSSITTLGISGNLTVRAEDNSSNQGNATLSLTAGTITVGGTLINDAENDGAGSGSATAVVTTATGAQSGTLSLSGATAYSAPGTGTATFTATGTTAKVNYSGAAQTVVPTSYRNLILSGSGAKTLAGVTTINTDLTVSGSASATTASAMTVGNDIILNNTASLTTGNTLDLTGDLTVNSGTTFTIGGFNFDEDGNASISGTLVHSSTTGTKTFNGSVTINTGGVWDNSANEGVTFNGGLAHNGTTFTAGTGVYLFNNDQTISGSTAISIPNVSVGFGDDLTNTANLTITASLAGTGELINAAAGRLFINFGGTVGITTLTASAAGNIVDYSFAGAQNVKVTNGNTYSNLILSGSGIKTFGATTVNALLSIQGAATTAGTAVAYAAAGVLEYKGSGAQNTSAVEFAGTSGTTPANLKIDNTNGVTLNAAKTINGILTLQSGYLTTTSGTLLTLGTAATAPSPSNGAFVNGPMAKMKNTTTLFTFPVGTLTGGLRTIGVTPQTTVAATYRATFFSADPKTVTNGTNLGAVPRISACEYWDLTQTAGTTATKVTLSWPAAANSCGNGPYVTDVNTLIVAHHNGTNWTNEGGAGFTGDATNGGTVTSTNNLSSFSPFALGATNINQNPLPVMFSDVKAFEKNHGVQIEWSNLTERDLVNYIVERSANGVNFTAISQQLPRSNQNDKEMYSAFDASPFAGANFYRIKVLEISGKIIYSKILKVEIGGRQQGFTLYPNPVTGGQLSVSFNGKQGQYSLKVLNTSGQEVYSQKISHQGGSMTQAIDLPSTVKPGVYNVMISGDNYRESKKFIVQ